MQLTSILVTGGAGFIGANLIRQLLETTSQTIHVLIHPEENTWRLNGLETDIVTHIVDLTHYQAVHELIDTIRPSTIYHLASFGGMPNEKNQKHIFDVNFCATVNLINACKEVGFDCFIHTGSSSEYGLKQEALHERMILEPVSDYAVAKAAATQFCLKEALFNKLPIYTVRPFSVYGDFETPTRLIPTVITNALANTPFALSSPNNVRDFIYIKDMVNLLITVAQQKPLGEYIFNAGTGTQSRIEDVVLITQNLLNTTLSIHWGSVEPRPWEPTHWCANMMLTNRVLGWKAQYSLAQGLEASLAWFGSMEKTYDTAHKQL